jgi:hypothetical protein
MSLPQGLRQSFGGSGITIGNHHPRAFIKESFYNCFPNPARSPSHDSNFVREFHDGINPIENSLLTSAAWKRNLTPRQVG